MTHDGFYCPVENCEKSRHNTDTPPLESPHAHLRAMTHDEDHKAALENEAWKDTPEWEDYLEENDEQPAELADEDEPEDEPEPDEPEPGLQDEDDEGDEDVSAEEYDERWQADADGDGGADTDAGDGLGISGQQLALVAGTLIVLAVLIYLLRKRGAPGDEDAGAQGSADEGDAVAAEADAGLVQ